MIEVEEGTIISQVSQNIKAFTPAVFLFVWILDCKERESAELKKQSEEEKKAAAVVEDH